MSFCNLLGYIWQSLCLDHVNSNVNANFYQNIPKSSWERGLFHFFFKFEPRQNLDQSQMSFDNLIGYILLLSMYIQNLSQYSSQFKRLGHFHFFWIWSSAKPRPIKKCQFAISWARSCHYQCLRKSYQNIPLSSRDRAIFTFSEFGTRQSLDRR